MKRYKYKVLEKPHKYFPHEVGSIFTLMSSANLSRRPYEWTAKDENDVPKIYYVYVDKEEGLKLLNVEDQDFYWVPTGFTKYKEKLIKLFIRLIKPDNLSSSKIDNVYEVRVNNKYFKIPHGYFFRAVLVGYLLNLIKFVIRSTKEV